MVTFRLVAVGLIVVGRSLTRADDLWRVERANAAACEHIVESLEATITTDPTYRGVVTCGEINH